MRTEIQHYIAVRILALNLHGLYRDTRRGLKIFAQATKKGIQPAADYIGQ